MSLLQQGHMHIGVILIIEGELGEFQVDQLSNLYSDSANPLKFYELLFFVLERSLLLKNEIPRVKYLVRKSISVRFLLKC